ncbi:hypothetical protein ACN42_g8267 [Penicillium freii]|uniref:Uncharacterized protein n=1 Tax=Penicillium freii TaxID=48697 RepID=A0A117NM90_PENFR|nr:hypothetical protein ACN42_g8267 [Penicillium freii]
MIPRTSVVLLSNYCVDRNRMKGVGELMQKNSLWRLYLAYDSMRLKVQNSKSGSSHKPRGLMRNNIQVKN